MTRSSNAPPADEQVLAIMSALSLTPIPQLRVSYTRTHQGWVCAVSKLGAPDFKFALGADQEGAALALLAMLMADVRHRARQLQEIITWVDSRGQGLAPTPVTATVEDEDPDSQEEPPPQPKKSRFPR